MEELLIRALKSGADPTLKTVVATAFVFFVWRFSKLHTKISDLIEVSRAAVTTHVEHLKEEKRHHAAIEDLLEEIADNTADTNANPVAGGDGVPTPLPRTPSGRHQVGRRLRRPRRVTPIAPAPSQDLG